jgi:hypothetical protein
MTKPRPFPAGCTSDGLRCVISVHDVPASRLMGCRPLWIQSEYRFRTWGVFCPFGPMRHVWLPVSAKFRGPSLMKHTYTASSWTGV